MLFKKKYFALVILLTCSLLNGCLFEAINQPNSAQPGEIININLTIKSNIVPEPNPNKGLLGIVLPNDWDFISAAYTSELGNGSLEISRDWKDTVGLYYPADQFGPGMKWIVLISDKGYTYDDVTSFEVQLKLKVGQKLGCFNIGYLTTKAASGLISSKNSSWVPISFPHAIGVPNSNLCVTTYQTRPAEDWDNLFKRKYGWTGADGIYSIPLNGYDAPSCSPSDSQLILFSDTFIGEVDSGGQRHNARLINNSLALMKNNIPDTNNIRFFWGKDSTNSPKSVFVPNTPNANPGDWYWLMDGTAINDTVYVFALRLNNSGGNGAFNFEVNGVVLLKFNIDSQNFISNVKQYDTPLYFKNEPENWNIVLGQAVMPMTYYSGNPLPDGYIYIYGPRNSSSGKELVAARVLPEEIENFNKWKYWDGNTWGDSIKNCKAVSGGISQEFSVSPIKDGKYLLVFQMGNNVAIKTGTSPVGPFGISNSIYNCPEVLIDPDIFVYNAKAHPNLSTKDDLLISYNVNTFNFEDNITNADIYRPRFIYLNINDTTTTSIGNSVLPDHFKLYQNYPNPFSAKGGSASGGNPSTTIRYSIPQTDNPLLGGARGGLVNVRLKVYDVLGNEITTLVNKKQSPGVYEVKFDASSAKGGLASGIYFYQLRLLTVGRQVENGQFSSVKKMLLIK